MNTSDRQRLEGYRQRMEELRTWRNAREQPVEKWIFSTEEGETSEISLGELWPRAILPARFSASTRIPEGWAGESVELELWLGGEAFVSLSNGVQGGLDPFHRSFAVAASAKDGELLEIQAEVVPRGMWGTIVTEPRLERAHLVMPELGLRALERDLWVLVTACQVLDDSETTAALLDTLDTVFAELFTDWPSETNVTLNRYLQRYENPSDLGLSSLPPGIVPGIPELVPKIGRPWSMRRPSGALEPLPARTRQAVQRVQRRLADHLGEVKRRYPPVGSVALTGHAHLDLAWLWPVEETRRKARRTFASVLGLMDHYEDFTFNQSSAQLYEWVEEDDPEMFRRIRERVAEGRWEPVGGMWVEPDCQMIGDESFVRQLLYGQRYFEEKFGHRPTVAWLPDTFGFSPSLPQLLQQGGIEGIFLYKLKWNQTNTFPYDLFVWEGIDGSCVTAHSFNSPGFDYNGDVSPRDLLKTWRNFKGKRRHPESLFSFGWGDGGGGPSERMLQNYARLKEFPTMPRLRMTRVDTFFASLPQEGLPKWAGELYLELHRGTLTTQARIKKLNREAEHRLLEAEAFATISTLHGESYPAAEFEVAWKRLLLNQFHDILPGTSISEVNKEAHHQLVKTVNDATRLRNEALQPATSLTNQTNLTLFVGNSALYPRTLSLVLPANYLDEPLAGPDGESLPVQQTEEGLLVHAPDCRVPALGWTSLRENAQWAYSERWSGVWAENGKDGVILENELLRVVVSHDGTLKSCFYKEYEREVLTGRGNQLWVYTDRPANWDAWDVDEAYRLEGAELLEPERIEILETGPLRAAVRVERCWRNSSITQTYKLLSSSGRLDVDTEIDWHERQIFLRALFPINVRSHEAAFESMCGLVRRPTHRNTSWDAARFEVAAHRFCDLSEPGFGVALLNDGKYGHSAEDNVLGISLLRSPIYPDPLADEGRHRFTYSLFPHPDDLMEGGVVREAFALNSPLFGLFGGRDLPHEYEFVKFEGVQLALGSLKQAENKRSVVLRLYEPHGARGTCTLHFACRIIEAECINLLEDVQTASLEIEGQSIRFCVKPFQSLSLRLGLEPATYSG